MNNNREIDLSLADVFVKEAKKGDIDDLIFYEHSYKNCSEK